jgi:6-phosphogluconolactonase (cycloisomerase 2 family)
VETDSAVNSVLSYQRGLDGTLSYAGSYATGGSGSVAAGASADPLASQGGLALVNDGSELLAVNSGSDTVSVFAVRGAALHLLGQVPSGGSFPDSIAIHGDLVAVLNAGGAGAVAEFRLIGSWLVALPGQNRSLDLANTSPPNYLEGPGQVGYSPDGRFLVVTTKTSTNSYDVFSVGPLGQLSAAPTATPAQNANPFAFTFDAEGHLVAVEAATSSLSTYVINPNGSLSALGSVSDGQKALCWVTAVGGYFYGSNAASANVSSFVLLGSGAPTVLAATAASAQPGTTDSAASPDGQYLYVESGGSGVLDVFAVHQNGALAPVQTITGLPAPFEGIAVS